MQTKHIAVQGNLSEKSFQQKITVGVLAFALPIKHPGLPYFENAFIGSPIKLGDLNGFMLLLYKKKKHFKFNLVAGFKFPRLLQQTDYFS